MSFIIIITIFILCIWVNIDRCLSKQIKQLLLLYLIIWGVVIFFGRMEYFSLYQVRPFVSFLMLLHLFAFVAGVKYYFAIIHRPILVTNSFRLTIESGLQSLIKNKLFIIILFSSLIYAISKYSIFLVRVALLGDYGEVRGEYYSGELYGPEFPFVNSLILAPMSYICNVLFGFLLFKKKNWVFVILTSYIFIYSSLSGGRFQYVYIVFAVLFAIVLLSNVKIKKYIPKLLIIAAVFYLLLAYITAARYGDTELTMENIKDNGIEEVNEHMFTYSCGPQVAFQYAIDRNYVNRIGGYQYGGITFCSVINLFGLVSAKLGLPISQPADNIGFIQEEQINIGNNVTWNALYTSVLYYYMDGGVVGVFIFPFIFGLLFIFIGNKMYAKKSIWFLFLFYAVFTAMLKSISNFNITNGWSLMALIIIYYLGSIKGGGKKHQVISQSEQRI